MLGPRRSASVHPLSELVRARFGFAGCSFEFRATTVCVSAALVPVASGVLVKVPMIAGVTVPNDHAGAGVLVVVPVWMDCHAHNRCIRRCSRRRAAE